MYGYIYRITDLTNGKCYIGQHKYDKPMLDPTYHGSGQIIKQIYKKRPETLLEEILMICATLDEANYFETYFIERMNTLYPNGYNLSGGGDLNPMNYEICRQHQKEGTNKPEVKQQRLKTREEHGYNTRGENNPMYGKGYLISGEKNGMYGKTHTDEYKQILHDKMSGEGNPQYGKKGELATCYGRTGAKHPLYGKHWYNNGICNILSDKCPEGFIPGKLQNKQKNNE